MARQYSLPDFNLKYSIWRAPTTPFDGPPELAGLDCQLYFNSQARFENYDSNLQAFVPTIFLRTPPDQAYPQVNDIVAIGVASSNYYGVYWSDTIHRGFPNAYRVSVVCQCTSKGISPRVPIDDRGTLEPPAAQVLALVREEAKRRGLTLKEGI